MHRSDSGTSPDIGGAGARALPGRPPPLQPPSPPRPGAIVGVARDAQGAALPLAPVEMRGFSFEGSVDDGDWVEAPGVWRPGVTLHPRRVRNLTTGAQMGVRGGGGGERDALLPAADADQDARVSGPRTYGVVAATALDYLQH
jgi:hypothetical protein